ncbi:putative cytosol aminopeptidase [Amylibacter marinus]|uniref:Probable cytosol aminopeptidase n=1 Tax=Amylibacter marinus TaxID=1475483 RepID=A0ABQ5VSH6_9RHOB|nr:leucyl aminopeptidase [Amylibacter marinus]GLQ34131.1 putative cytosol aminopeptidase [Amylibacter marinus]
MSSPITPNFIDPVLDDIATLEGSVVVVVGSDESLDMMARRVNRLTKGAINRFVEGQSFADMPAGATQTFVMPAGMAAEQVILTKLSKKADTELSRKAGANVGKSAGKTAIHLLVGPNHKAADIAFGVALRRYGFNDHKTKEAVEYGAVSVHSTKFEALAVDYGDMDAVAQGVFFTRDLINEPANVLTTTEFANRLIDLEKLGVKVTVLEEADMQKLGMGALLSVGHGSDSPSKTVIMEWNGGGDEQPFALVGKGVVFDTGGISLKPAAGMEDMTMDMGGAGVVSGVMKTLALRKAKANVVGLVGLVENMPDARATRPGDVVTSMKGTTIEVINTDAEGRLVLADVLHYAQETYKPSAIINLATLTGAIIIGLGHENAGVFSNDDKLSASFLKSANAEAEGAWRMPMGAGYDKLIESRIADIQNIGGRAAGSITAAQFLQRFVADDMPWIHLDIAGVASVKSETDFAPKGATGWGVKALNRLIADNYEA